MASAIPVASAPFRLRAPGIRDMYREPPRRHHQDIAPQAEIRGIRPPCKDLCRPTGDSPLLPPAVRARSLGEARSGLDFDCRQHPAAACQDVDLPGGGPEAAV